MKPKALLLVVCAAAGVGASVAVAGNRNGGGPGDRGKACRATMIAGTVAPQTFTLTVMRALGHGSPAPGSTLAVTIGGSGQTVVASVGACSGGSGTTTTSSPLTVRSVDLRARPTPAATTTTTAEDHHDDGHRRHRATTTVTTTSTTP